MARRRGRHAQLQALRDSEGYPLDPLTSADRFPETVEQCAAIIASHRSPAWIPELLACIFYSVARQNPDLSAKYFGFGDDLVGELWKEAPGSVSAFLSRAVGNYSKGRVLPMHGARQKRLLDLADADVSACLKLDPNSPAVLALRIEIDTALLPFPGEPNARTLAERIVANCERLAPHAPRGLNPLWSLLRAHEKLWDEDTDAKAVGHLEAAIEVAEILLVRDPKPMSLHGKIASLLWCQLHSDGVREVTFLRILRKLLDHIGESLPEDDLALEVLDQVEHDILAMAAKGPATPERQRAADRIFARMSLTRGRALLRRGRDASATLRCARKMYERLQGAYPDVVELHEDLAVIHRGLGDQEAVEREIDVVRKLRPERLPSLRRALKTWMCRG